MPKIGRCSLQEDDYLANITLLELVSSTNPYQKAAGQEIKQGILQQINQIVTYFCLLPLIKINLYNETGVAFVPLSENFSGEFFSLTHRVGVWLVKDNNNRHLLLNKHGLFFVVRLSRVNMHEKVQIELNQDAWLSFSIKNICDRLVVLQHMIETIHDAALNKSDPCTKATYRLLRELKCF